MFVILFALVLQQIIHIYHTHIPHTLLTHMQNYNYYTYDTRSHSINHKLQHTRYDTYLLDVARAHRTNHSEYVVDAKRDTAVVFVCPRIPSYVTYLFAK